MNRLEVGDALTGMFVNVPDAANHFDVALTRATIADINGTAPIHPGWVETYDLWIAAAEVAELLGIHSAMTPGQVLTQFESEGSRFVYGGAAATDWFMVARQLRSRSSLISGSVYMVDVGSPAEPFYPRSAAAPSLFTPTPSPLAPTASPPVNESDVDFAQRFRDGTAERFRDGTA